MGWWKKRKRKKKRALKRGAELLEDLIECCDGKSNPIKFFSANEIRKATEMVFYYKWYSGKNKNNHKILIKKVARSPYFYGQVNFCRDIAISSMVSGHKNFLKLIGCCLEFEDPVMVYHDVKNHYKLGGLREQPWKRRMKIAEDIATALAYLHNAFPRPFVYRNLSLENILLDEDGVAKLRDFSFCVSIPKGETFVRVDRIVGSLGLMDEKYKSSGVVSEGTDVFAIGMFMIINILIRSSRKETFFRDVEASRVKDYINHSGEFFDMVITSDPRARKWLSKLIKERRVEEIADPKMGEISEEELRQMKAFQKLSMRCIDREGEVPTMVEVAKELKKIQRSLESTSSSPSVETQSDSSQDISSYSPQDMSFYDSSDTLSPR